MWQSGAMAIGVIISACIIARDEEQVLGRCFGSIREACDEICVVDTGSSDGTAALARQSGAKVARFTECNDAAGRMADFALARNRSLELATGKWILWIDADEVLLPASVRRVRRHTSAGDHDAVRIRLENGRSRWPAVRLFRRTQSTRFYGTVHEWPSVDGITKDDHRIVIRNLPDKRGKESSTQRDLRLCALALDRDPLASRMLLYMGRALQKDGNLERAIVQYQEYLRVERRFRPGRHHARHNIAVCHLLAARWNDALAAAASAARMERDRAESHCVVGDACFALGRVDEAKAAYLRAIECPPPAPEYPMFTDLFFYLRYPQQRLRRIAALRSIE